MTEPTPTAELIAEARRYVDGEVGGRLAMDIITRLADALAQAEEARAKTAWRPIAEAPRDGSWVLLYSAKWPITCYAMVGWSDGPGEEWQFPAHPQWSAEMPYPTHWKPLPQPPTETD